MELRDSGGDLVQIKDDGAHVILPATTPPMVPPDRVRLPVMWLRHADGNMRRGGYPAAQIHPIDAVDLHGRLAGAPGLAVVDEHVLTRIRRPCRSEGERRQW